MKKLSERKNLDHIRKACMKETHKNWSTWLLFKEAKLIPKTSCLHDKEYELFNLLSKVPSHIKDLV